MAGNIVDMNASSLRSPMDRKSEIIQRERESFIFIKEGARYSMSAPPGKNMAELNRRTSFQYSSIPFKGTLN